MLMQQFPPTAFLKPVDSEPTRDELNNPNSISHGFETLSRQRNFIREGDPTIETEETTVKMIHGMFEEF